MRGENHDGGSKSAKNSERMRLSVLPKKEKERNQGGGKGAGQKFVLEGTLSTDYASANFWIGTNATQETEYIYAAQLLQNHTDGNDEANDGESTERAIDILLVKNQVSQNKESANRIEEETCLIDDRSRIERKDQHAGD